MARIGTSTSNNCIQRVPASFIHITRKTPINTKCLQKNRRTHSNPILGDDEDDIARSLISAICSGLCAIENLKLITYHTSRQWRQTISRTFSFTKADVHPFVRVRPSLAQQTNTLNSRSVFAELGQCEDLFIAVSKLNVNENVRIETARFVGIHARNACLVHLEH